MAAATLSGMVRGMTPAEAAALRERLVAQCASLFGPGPGAAGRRRGAPLPPRGGPGGGAGAAGAGAAGAQQHAVVQGLKAFVLSSPYDCPLWMAPVLMALVAAATSSAAGAQVRGGPAPPRPASPPGASASKRARRRLQKSLSPLRF